MSMLEKTLRQQSKDVVQRQERSQCMIGTKELAKLLHNKTQSSKRTSFKDQRSRSQ